MSYLTTTREPIYAGLFAFVASVPGIITSTRTWVPWNDLADYNQPMLVQVEGDESFVQRKGLPPKKTFAVDLYLYAKTDQTPDGVTPAQTLNLIIDAIEAKTAPVGIDETQTLGGLVSHAWIEGVVRKDPGIIDGQAVCVIPIRILTAE